MSEKAESGSSKEQAAFSREVGAKAARKLRARRNSAPGVWLGLGMMGIVGWSVAVPVLLGVAFGIWLDKRHTGPHSWTLMMLVIGLVIGCWLAWHWVSREDRKIREDKGDKEIQEDKEDKNE